MASDRDTLAGLIAEHFPEYISGHCLCGSEALNLTSWSAHVADAMAASGVRPPAQVIETPEALAALPTGTVIRDANGEFHCLDPYGIEKGTWFPAWLTGSAQAQDFGQAPLLNATVVWSPTEKAGTE